MVLYERCENALKTPIEIMEIRYVLADFELLYFSAKIKTQWNFWILFSETVHQKGLLEQKKSWILASVAGFLKITDNLS